MAAARGSCRRASVIKLAAGAFPTACRFSFLGFELSFSLGSLSFFFVSSCILEKRGGSSPPCALPCVVAVRREVY